MPILPFQPPCPGHGNRQRVTSSVPKLYSRILVLLLVVVFYLVGLIFLLHLLLLGLVATLLQIHFRLAQAWSSISISVLGISLTLRREIRVLISRTFLRLL